MRLSLISLLSLPVLLLACASGGTGTAASTDNPRLTQAEIVEADLPTAFDLVDRLRRPWLRRDALTGGEVVIYMDNQNIGGAQKLREIPSVEVAELVYMPNDEAIRRWGSQIRGSVIVITRRR